jgi:hypothetical protein
LCSTFSVAGIGPVRHQHRISSGDGPCAVSRDWVEPQRDRVLGRHHQQRGGTVGDLRRVARVDDAIIFERRLELGEFLDAGAPSHSLVGDHRFTSGEHRDHLALEGTAVLCGRSTLM